MIQSQFAKENKAENMLMLVFVMLAIASFEAPKLLKQKQYGELLAFSVMWGMAFGYAALVVMRVELPSLINVLEFVYAFVGLQ